MKLALDLDGVMYDFVGELRKHAIATGYAKRYDLAPADRWDFYEKQWGWSQDTYWDVFADAVLNGELFWKGAPIPGTKSAFKKLHRAGHELVIVTHREHPDAKVDHFVKVATTQWLQSQGLEYDGLEFNGDKHELTFDVMLDDSPAQIVSALEAGQRAVCFDQPWNRVPELEHAERVCSWFQFVMLVGGS